MNPEAITIFYNFKKLSKVSVSLENFKQKVPVYFKILKI